MHLSRNQLIFATVLIYVIILVWMFINQAREIQTPAVTVPNPAVISGARTIRINEPIELDFKSREEIFRIRKAYVDRNRDLIPGEYMPSHEVFGGIVSGKPWWGINGQFCNATSGNRSIEGVSEESRFLINPFLLLGLSEVQGWNVGGWCFPVYPRPVSLSWYPSEKKAEVVYDMTRFYREKNRVGFAADLVRNSDIYLHNVNARDLGYEYIHVVPEWSPGVLPSGSKQMFTDVCELRSFIHSGSSCGYPGGCNNESPLQEGVFFKVGSIPAKLYCKLWKNSPVSVDQEPDFTFIIKLE